MTDSPLSNAVLVQEIIRTGQKVSSIEAKIDSFLVEQASLKREVEGIREDVDELKSARKTDRAFIAGIIAVVSPAAAFGVAWFRNWLGF